MLNGPPLDLSACAREPIHIPGSIQPHGLLAVLAEDDLRLLQISENSLELLGVDPAAAPGLPLERLLGDAAAARLRGGLAEAPAGSRPALLGRLSLGDPVWDAYAVAHRTDGGIVLELERIAAAAAVPDLHPVLDAFTLQAENSVDLDDLCRVTTREIARFTGFDRVLIYRFDEDWHGTVIGEHGNGRLPSYLHHRFPASDIPAQARELYRSNRLRIIPDAGYQPLQILPAANPRTGRPLDMSFSTLRSVSPVHVEYMRNMGTAASMSVSILREGKLWGLISCHHAEARHLPYPVRTTCDLLARAFSLRLAAIEQHEDYRRRLEIGALYARLLEAMADRLDHVAGLADRPDDLLAFVAAKGAAILKGEQCLLIGRTPGEAEVRALSAWLFERGAESYCTDALPSAYPPARAFKDSASGLLAIAVSKLHASQVLWFRPEVAHTIEWAGDPAKPVDTGGGAPRLHPRLSFATWKETVLERSAPWRPGEVQGAADLRNAIVGTVLRQAEELAALNAELTRSNTELEAFSYSVSHDLRAPLRHIVGYAEIMKELGADRLSPREQRCLDTIIESSEYAGTLVDKLLAFSRLGRAELQLSAIDMNALVDEIRRELAPGLAARRIDWQVEPLPVVQADLVMLRTAFRNLIDNAVKYSRDRDDARIAIGCSDAADEYVFHVRDNGIGFDMRYVDKLFGVFQRLHRMEDYEGTGIGLANVRRVAERHGGRTWAEGVEGQGATFYFTLPKTPA